jgi:hypothetical protein
MPRRKRFSLEDYRSAMLNKIFGFITVIDVYANPITNRAMCKYICKCGTVKEAEARRIFSGRLLSCGCYKSSNEFKSKISQWFKNNPDKIKERSEKYSKTINSDCEYFLKRAKSYNETYKKFRHEKFNDFYADYIHQDDLQLIINGDIDSHDYVRSKCPECNEYHYHLFSSFIDTKTGLLKRNRPPLCKHCYSNMTSSQYEIELRQFVSQLGYDYITNDREVLHGIELDIYIPSKQIAIEFNGDYWHNVNKVSKDKHYKKFISCYNNGIILVSIFENIWNSNRDKIKNYIIDLLNNRVNDLSYDKPGYMNNNYPLPLSNILLLNIKPSLSIEDFYTYYKYIVYTCGYSEIN